MKLRPCIVKLAGNLHTNNIHNEMFVSACPSALIVWIEPFDRKHLESEWKWRSRESKLEGVRLETQGLHRGRAKISDDVMMRRKCKRSEIEEWVTRRRNNHSKSCDDIWMGIVKWKGLKERTKHKFQSNFVTLRIIRLAKRDGKVERVTSSDHKRWISWTFCYFVGRGSMSFGIFARKHFYIDDIVCE